MLAPWTTDGITLNFTGEVTSRSYVDMTTGLLREACAADVEESMEGDRIRVAPSHIPGFEHRIEPDASAATYLWSWAALFPKSKVRVPGVHFTSRQSDARFLMTLRQMGCTIEYAAGAADCTGPKEIKGFDEVLAGTGEAGVDFEQMPDASLTLAAVACFASSPTTITGLRTLKVKETDRLAALHAELSKIGVTTTITDDSIRIAPPAGGVDTSETVPDVYFDTYDDHRMAMALSLIALRRPNTFINDPACVRKTFPEYWGTIATLYDAALDEPA
jgi:3-phosphoshikimate 1-carboxyvinyltransferase